MTCKIISVIILSVFTTLLSATPIPRNFDNVLFSVNLDFNSLPSNQGWEYEAIANPNSNNAPEEDVFWLSDGVLTNDTIGLGLNSGDGGNLYHQKDVVNTSLGFIATITARILEVESNTGQQQVFCLGVFTGTEIFNIEFGIDYIQDQDDNPFQLPDGFTTTVFHEYRLEHFLSGDTYNFFIDGEFIGSGSSRKQDVHNWITFGDQTAGANVHAEMTSYDFVQGTFLSVPESTNFILAILGLSFLAFQYKAKN